MNTRNGVAESNDRHETARVTSVLTYSCSRLSNSAGDVATHLEESGSLAAHTGERNHFRFHFGPSNVAAWALSIAVESGTGAEAAERFTAAPIDLSVFGSKHRESFVHFDLARAGCKPREPATVRRCARSTLPTGSRHYRCGTTPSLGTWFSRWTGVPGVGYGSWTRCVTASASGAPGLKHCVEAGADLDRSLVSSGPAGGHHAVGRPRWRGTSLGASPNRWLTARRDLSRYRDADLATQTRLRRS